jgi:hypothetical protein
LDGVQLLRFASQICAEDPFKNYNNVARKTAGTQVRLQPLSEELIYRNVQDPAN